MAMSKKHYTAIADVFNRWFVYFMDDNPDAVGAIDLIVADLSDVFADDNSNFDIDRFKTAVYETRSK